MYGLYCSESGFKQTISKRLTSEYASDDQFATIPRFLSLPPQRLHSRLSRLSTFDSLFVSFLVFKLRLIPALYLLYSITFATHFSGEKTLLSSSMQTHLHSNTVSPDTIGVQSDSVHLASETQRMGDFSITLNMGRYFIPAFGYLHELPSNQYCHQSLSRYLN